MSQSPDAGSDQDALDFLHGVTGLSADAAALAHALTELGALRAMTAAQTETIARLQAELTRLHADAAHTSAYVDGTVTKLQAVVIRLIGAPAPRTEPE